MLPARGCSMLIFSGPEKRVEEWYILPRDLFRGGRLPSATAVLIWCLLLSQ